eukprot:GHVR01011443.1.p1 GENE.GHVR01011443.1~~GHVR01011443.1.p1  ORF type:complete len:824 (+),score=155.86 GHVR01011443.1:489-2960(+)
MGCTDKETTGEFNRCDCTSKLDNKQDNDNNKDNVNKPTDNTHTKDNTHTQSDTHLKTLSLVRFYRVPENKSEIFNMLGKHTYGLKCNCIIGTLDMYSPESIFFDKVFKYKKDTEGYIIQTITDKSFAYTRSVTRLHVDRKAGLRSGMTLHTRGPLKSHTRYSDAASSIKLITFNMSEKKSGITSSELFKALPIECKGKSKTDSRYVNFLLILRGMYTTEVPNYSSIHFLTAKYLPDTAHKMVKKFTREDIKKFWKEGGCGEQLKDYMYSSYLFRTYRIVKYKLFLYKINKINISAPLVNKDLFINPIISYPVYNKKDPWNFVLYADAVDTCISFGTHAIKDNVFNDEGEFLHFYHTHTSDILHRNNNKYAYRAVITNKIINTITDNNADVEDETHLFNRIENALIDSPLMISKYIINQNMNTFPLKILNNGVIHTCVFHPTSIEIILLYDKEITLTDGCKSLSKNHKVNQGYTKYECWNKQNKNKKISVVAYVEYKSLPESIKEMYYALGKANCNCIVGTGGSSHMFYDKVLKYSKFNEKDKHTQDIQHTQENKIEEEVIKVTIVPRDDYTHTHTHTSVCKPTDTIETVLYRNYYTGRTSIGYLKDIAVDNIWRTRTTKGRLTRFNLLRVNSAINMKVLREQLPSVCDSKGDTTEWGNNFYIIMKAMLCRVVPTKHNHFLKYTSQTMPNYIKPLKERDVDEFWRDDGCGVQLRNQIITIKLDTSDDGNNIILRGPLINKNIFATKSDRHAEQISDEDPWLIKINWNEPEDTIGLKLIEDNKFNSDGDFLHYAYTDTIQIYNNITNTLFNNESKINIKILSEKE